MKSISINLKPLQAATLLTLKKMVLSYVFQVWCFFKGNSGQNLAKMSQHPVFVGRIPRLEDVARHGEVSIFSRDDSFQEGVSAKREASQI